MSVLTAWFCRALTLLEGEEMEQERKGGGGGELGAVQAAMPRNNSKHSRTCTHIAEQVVEGYPPQKEAKTRRVSYQALAFSLVCVAITST